LDIPHNHGAVVLREDLRSHLYQAAQSEGIEFRFAHECNEINYDGTFARLCFANGVEAEHSMVLACDGSNSRVRTAIGVPANIVQASYVTYAGISNHPYDPHCTHEIWSSDGGYFGLCPLPRGKSFFYSRGVPITQLSNWVERWRSESSEVAEILDGTDLSKIVRTEFREVHLRRWYKPPVFFLGDAAHAMRPNLGQGANSSMVDALVLTKLIARSYSGPRDVEAIGKEYERIRKSFVWETQLFARQIDGIRSLTGNVERCLRDGFLRTSQFIPRANQYVMRLVAGYNRLEENLLN
jgi:2-polyprenyl-6-methoxyphenol hydroxylase-like FAD-dependent oxidoreductase